MEIGDLVEYSGNPEESEDRGKGIVIALDVYRGSSDRLDTLAVGVTPIAEVLWSHGPGWIARDRVKVICKDRHTL